MPDAASVWPGKRQLPRIILVSDNNQKKDLEYLPSLILWYRHIPTRLRYQQVSTFYLSVSLCFSLCCVVNRRFNKVTSLFWKIKEQTSVNETPQIHCPVKLFVLSYIPPLFFFCIDKETNHTFGIAQFVCYFQRLTYHLVCCCPQAVWKKWPWPVGCPRPTARALWAASRTWWWTAWSSTWWRTPWTAPKYYTVRRPNKQPGTKENKNKNKHWEKWGNKSVNTQEILPHPFHSLHSTHVSCCNYFLFL